MPALSDQQLIGMTLNGGHRQAFGLLVERHQQQVRRFFLSQLSGNSPVADDLSQETFVKAYEHLPQFRGTSSFPTWLMRIAYHVLLDYVRARKDLPASSLLSQQQPSPQSSIALRHDIYKALDVLRPEERLCITMQLVDGYSVADIASVTQMAEGTVKSHLSRGKNKLAEYLRKNGYDRR